MPIYTNNIERNQRTRPEWYVSPESIEPEVAQYLAWQSAQPNPIGPGTIADAWEQGGTGPLYHAHVTQAREQVALWHSRADLQQAAGNPFDPAPWATPQPGPQLDQQLDQQPAAAPNPAPGGFVIGGTAVAAE